jgi:hypothetical protein
VHSLLRLGTKYEIEDLRAEALYCLKQLLPGDLQSWDNALNSPPIPYEQIDFISMANLTNELGLDTLHARALYRCSQLPTHYLINGMQRTHGVWERISSVDAIACIDARVRLSIAKLELIEDIIHTCGMGQCFSGSSDCTTNRKLLAARRLSKLWKVDSNVLEPSEAWFQHDPNTMRTHPLCLRCEDDFKIIIDQRRNLILSRLRNFFSSSLKNPSAAT